MGSNNRAPQGRTWSLEASEKGHHEGLVIVLLTK